MVRTQIQLSERQARELKRLAAERGGSMAELVREAVDALLRDRHGPSREQRWSRARAVVGKFHSGHDDIAEQHDRYLLDAYEA